MAWPYPPGAGPGRASAEGLTSAEGLAGQRRSKIQRYLALVTAVAAAAAGEDHQGRVRERPALCAPAPPGDKTLKYDKTDAALRHAAHSVCFGSLTWPVEPSVLSIFAYYHYLWGLTQGQGFPFTPGEPPRNGHPALSTGLALCQPGTLRSSGTKSTG
jgi:hypothetical protein